jgi:hypothetical protein
MRQRQREAPESWWPWRALVVARPCSTCLLLGAAGPAAAGTGCGRQPTLAAGGPAGRCRQLGIRTSQAAFQLRRGERRGRGQRGRGAEGLSLYHAMSWQGLMAWVHGLKCCCLGSGKGLGGQAAWQEWGPVAPSRPPDLYVCERETKPLWGTCRRAAFACGGSLSKTRASCTCCCTPGSWRRSRCQPR